MIPLFKVLMAPDAHERVKEVLYSGYIAQGEVVEQFEAALETYLGAPTVTVNSGTSAIELALALVGVHPGDEVITSPMTCAATTCAILNRGGRPVWADVDPLTGNIDPEDVTKKVSPRTKAIIAVDWGGRPCKFTELNSIGPTVIEDAAHAFMPLQRETGEFVALSFQAIKTLNTGDGGALVCPTDQVERAKRLRWFGIDRKEPDSTRWLNDLPEPGFKFHMNNIAAAIGLANLPVAIKALKTQRDNARFYDQQLREALRHILPPWTEDSAWWLYTLRVPDRRQFITYMAEQGITASPVHARNDKHSGMNFYNGLLPGVSAFAANNVCIPVGWWLTEGDRVKIVEAVHAWSQNS